MFNSSSQQDEQLIGGEKQIRTESYKDTLADITRLEFDDYKSRFLPVQEHLFSLANSDQLLNEQLARNKANIDNSFTQAQQTENRTLSRFGISANDTQQNKNNHNLQKSLATASINNETRSSVDELQHKILTGQGGKPQTLAQMGKS